MVKRFFIIAILIVGGCLITKAQTSKYDLNGDGDVNVADVTELVNYILKKEDNSGDNPEGVVASALVGIWTQYHTGGATAWYYGIKLDANGEAAYSEWDVKKSPNWTYTGGGPILQKKWETKRSGQLHCGLPATRQT